MGWFILILIPGLSKFRKKIDNEVTDERQVENEMSGAQRIGQILPLLMYVWQRGC